MRAGQSEAGFIVIETTRSPGGSIVTTDAVGGEVVGFMVRVDNACEVDLMAANAIGGSTGVAIGMTTLTIQRSVCSGERKSGLVMREVRRLPGGGGMALGAIVGEAALIMVRVARCSVGCRMTAVAV